MPSKESIDPNYLFRNSESQKSLTYNYFVAVFQRLAVAGFQTPATIHKRAVGRAKVLNHVLAVLKRNARMPPRYFRFGIFGIQVHIGKDATVCVPTADVRFVLAQAKLPSR